MKGGDFLYYYYSYLTIDNNYQYLFHSNPNVLSSNQGDCQKVFDAILKSIKREATAIDFYSRLLKVAPSVQAKEAVLHALEDEKIHLRDFTNLYVRMTGKQPNYQIIPVKFSTFKEGLRLAYRDELEAYEFYRDIYLMTQNITIRDVYLRGFTDEIEHATRFGFLLTGLD